MISVLGPEDRERTLQYIADHMASELGLELHVRPVSVEPRHEGLLEQWFAQDLLPLYDRHVDFAQASLKRKVGALTEAVAAALQARLQHATRVSASEASRCQKLEKALRQTAGQFSDTRQKSREMIDKLRSCGDMALTEVASELMDGWQGRGAVKLAPLRPRSGGGPLAGRISSARVHDILSRVAAERAVAIASACTALARDAAQVLQDTAQALGLSDAPSASEMTAEVQEMPWLDVGQLDIKLRPPGFLMRIGKNWARRPFERRLRAQVGAQVVKAFTDYGRLLEAWLDQKLTALQRRFEAYADAYRAQLGRLANGEGSSLPEQETIRKDLEALLGSQPDEAPGVGHWKV